MAEGTAAIGHRKQRYIGVILDSYRFKYLRSRAAERIRIALSAPRDRKAAAAKVLFVLGTGRSGTHFLTRCLISNPEIRDAEQGREDPRIFKPISDAAANLSAAPRVLETARSHYYRQWRKKQQCWFADQTHPNIWFAEYWASVFPNARFIGITRHPYSVIYSTLQHAGVRRWGEEWANYPLPSPLLGLTIKNAHNYRSMSQVERYAVRWLAHYRRLEHLETVLGERLTTIRYEDLCAAQVAVLKTVSTTLGISDHFAPPVVNVASLDKHAGLTDQQTSEIDRVLRDGGYDIASYKIPRSKI